jgi:serine protease AprX
LNLIGGVAVTIPGNKLDKLAQTDGLIVTPDGKVKVSSAYFSRQLWPYVSGNAKLWGSDNHFTHPAIAVIDSGIDTTRAADFGARVIASVTLTTLPNNSPGDGRGHGTMVAGIAAGAAAGYAGADPTANLVSVDVMDDNGMGMTSDVIAACQWVLDHKDQYNIKVVNMSLHSGITAPFYYDPLDKAVEKLWFNGVTVVAAAGNYAVGGARSDVRYSPADDPFVITVGAADLHGTVTTKDDTIAPWSAWGHTMDGFAKPEVSAPGRYMVGPVPTGSALTLLKPGNVVAPGYMQLSGTSFAAPVVAGAAAQIIARHPGWTPSQVKGAIMLSARTMDPSVGRAGGVGEITASKAAGVDNPPNPNAALEKFLVPSTSGGITFDSASWLDTIKANASWDSASWDSASWLAASWDSASWLAASWDSASWLDASTLSASWLDASWLDASWEDAAEGDMTASLPAVDSAVAAQLAADPLLAPDPTALPPEAIAPPAPAPATATPPAALP